MEHRYNTPYLTHKIEELLLRHSLTLSVAESVTSGNLQNAFAKEPNAPLFFQGGIVMEQLGQKTRMKHYISESLAVKMAQLIASMFSASVGIGVVGQDTNTDHGQHVAYCAIIMDNRVIATKKLRSRKKTISGIRKTYTEQILKWILTSLQARF